MARSLMTHTGHRPASHVAVAKPVSASIKALVWADTMPVPEPGGGHETACHDKWQSE